jgi:alkylation response protein AidB-like acyl-CoA dehydrogenase
VNFAFGEDQLLLRDSTRRFLADRHPLSALRDRLESPSTFDRSVWEEGAALGWTAMLVPAEHDGGSVTDQPVVDAVALAEELGRVLYPGPFLPTNVVADAIARDGSDAQRKQFLAPIASGELVAAWCLTADGSADVESAGVTATAGPDGALSLDGVARFVHDAHVADLLLVACRTPPGVVQVLVSPDAPGLGTRVMGGLDLTRRFCEVRFSGVAVDAEAVLGAGRPPNDGGAVSIGRSLQLATVLQAAGALGAADELFERTVQYAKDRVQFGRAIGSFQAIKHKLANLLIELEGARAATHYAALALADGTDDRDEAVAVAGSYVRDACAHLSGEALQIHGGIGFTWEHDVHLFVRRAKTEQLLYGDPSWHRERLCALVEAAVPDATGSGGV